MIQFSILIIFFVSIFLILKNVKKNMEKEQIINEGAIAFHNRQSRTYVQYSSYYKKLDIKSVDYWLQGWDKAKKGEILF